jgi:hypothetical protein
MLCLWLKFFLPNGVFGYTVQFRDLGESNYKLVLCFRSRTAAHWIGARLYFQVLEAKENTSCAGEPNDSLAAFKTFEQATDPFSHPWSYASGKQAGFLILKRL